jgi:hypothetical protein
MEHNVYHCHVCVPEFSQKILMWRLSCHFGELLHLQKMMTTVNGVAWMSRDIEGIKGEVIR